MKGGGGGGRLPAALAARVLQLANPYASLGFTNKAQRAADGLWKEMRPFTFLTSAPNKRSLPPQAPGLREVVLMGASNVGKSTLLNVLLGSKLAFTSKTPGHTKMLNFFEGQQHLRVVDVPGYGYGSHEKQMHLLGDYFIDRQDIACACLLMEARKGVKELDYMALSLLLEHQIPFQMFLTKADRLSTTQLRDKVLECERDLTLELQEWDPATEPVKVQPVSAKDRIGVSAVRASICALSGLTAPPTTSTHGPPSL